MRLQLKPQCLCDSLSAKHIVSDHEYDALDVVGLDCGTMENEDGMPRLIEMRDERRR